VLYNAGLVAKTYLVIVLQDLVEEAFQWQIRHANKGDFVVLRASGDDSYNQWIYNISDTIGYKLNSVTTLLFKNRKAASNNQLLGRIRNAEAIFFAGGDQGRYVNYWVNTGVQSIVQSKLGSVTVGGTSAGLAIQGQWVYTAVVDSAVSEEAMADPYYANMDFIAPAFLEIAHLASFITDTHFGKI
jgi:cyanophycinase-like exopeptidase